MTSVEDYNFPEFFQNSNSNDYPTTMYNYEQFTNAVLPHDQDLNQIQLHQQQHQQHQQPLSSAPASASTIPSSSQAGQGQASYQSQMTAQSGFLIPDHSQQPALGDFASYGAQTHLSQQNMGLSDQVNNDAFTFNNMNSFHQSQHQQTQAQQAQQQLLQFEFPSHDFQSSRAQRTHQDLHQQQHHQQSQHQQQQQLSFQAFNYPQSSPQDLHFAQPYERSRYLSEPNIINPLNQIPTNESTFSLSPDSVTFSTHSNTHLNSNVTLATTPDHSGDSSAYAQESSYQKYRVIRGISSGGSSTKPPKVKTKPNHHYAPAQLELVMASLEELCLPQWNAHELEDKRRIIRIERHQVGPKIIAEFSIVGSATENPTTLKAAPGVGVVEVSCLECYSHPRDDMSDDEIDTGYSFQSTNYSNDVKRNFYITSVEVIKIVELLIGTDSQDAADRRRERGRIRSNLVPFWSKKPISSRVSKAELENLEGSPIQDITQDFRIELATRIMAYEQRKPRGFDKEVRILKWEKLVPALCRALQSYYAEIPNDYTEEDEEIHDEEPSIKLSI